jgi:hypothetical protein
MSGKIKTVYHLVVPVVFPAGLAPGAGRTDGNLLSLSKDGRNRPVLRGTSIAGVLRHAWAQLHGLDPTPRGHDNALAQWFGFALGDDDSEGGEHRNLSSPLQVPDALLNAGGVNDDQAEQYRLHNSVDRHSGAVRQRALFSIGTLSPGTTANLVFRLHCDCSFDVAERFLGELTDLIDTGLIFGGHGARGLGLAVRNGPAACQRFDLRTIDGHAAWLDASWQWRYAPASDISSGVAVSLPETKRPQH